MTSVIGPRRPGWPARTGRSALADALRNTTYAAGGPVTDVWLRNTVTAARRLSGRGTAVPASDPTTSLLEAS